MAKEINKPKVVAYLGDSKLELATPLIVAGKEIKEIVTWDYVNEPGIHLAKKGFSPSLESHAQTYSDIDYCVFDERTILEARELVKESGVGNESTQAMFDILLRHGVVDTPYGKMYRARPSAAWRR